MIIKRHLLFLFSLLCFVLSNNLILASSKEDTVDFQPSGVQGFQLTPEENTWLSAHPDIRVGIMDAWPPMNFLDVHGRPQGIGVDYVKALNKRLGGKLTLVPGPFKENYNKVKQHTLDALMDITPKKDREPFFNFTRPYLTIPHVIVGRKGKSKYISENDLTGKTIALERGFYNVRYFNQNYPDIHIKEYDSTSEVLGAVSRGEADAYAGNRAVVLYLIEKELILNLQVQGRMKKPPVVLTIGVRKDWPELSAILDRTLASVTREETRQIHRRWMEDVEREEIIFELTPEERRWLAKHSKIEIGIMDAWPPMDFVDDSGKPRGIGVDFIDVLNKRLDGRLTVVPGPWQEIYEKVKGKKLDAVMGITPRKDREPYFNFTKPYANIPHVIIALKDGPYYVSLKELNGKTVAAEHGFFIIKYLKKNHPEVRIKEYKNTSDALDAVSKGAVDVYVGNRAVASYLMHKELLKNLQVQGKIKETASVNSIGVRKDWVELTAILDRALASLTREEIRFIYQKWSGIGKDEELALHWISLTPEEKTWLNAHPVIRVASDYAWAPLEFMDKDGKYKGISIDYLDRIAKTLGVELEFKRNISWKEAIDLVRRRELDIFSASMETPERKTFATFTRPYLSLPVVLFTLDNAPYIGGLSDLTGQKVAAVQGYPVAAYLKREYPEIGIIEVQNIPEALTLLQSKAVFAYMGTILNTGYYIRKGGYQNLKVSGQTAFKYEISMAARNDWPMMAEMLQKALNAIGEEERNTIFRKWMSITYEKRVNYSVIWKVLLGVFFLLSAFLYWNRRLAREVYERKQAEKALADARKNEIQIGARIQQALLLGVPPRDMIGLQIATLAIPSKGIDGDFYDFYRHADDCLDVVLGDVMGKGIHAALVGAGVKSQFLRSLNSLMASTNSLPEPKQIVQDVHRNIVKNLMELETFVTLCFARFHLKSRKVTLVDCGHTRTIHFQRSVGACTTLTGDHVPLGFLEKDIYKQRSAEIEPGNILFFYSDGVTEAQNKDGEQFGEDDLMACICRNGHLSADDLIQVVRNVIVEFTGSETFCDDLTCVAIRIMDPNWTESTGKE